MSKISGIPALVILDVQNGFDDPYWGERNNPDAEQNIHRLLTEWRRRKWEVIYSQHLSLEPQSPLNHKNGYGIEIKNLVLPLEGETVFTKNVNSAFIGTPLEVYLNEKKIKTLVLTGLSTQHCVSTTTRMAGNLGFTNFLVSDATAAFEITDHNKKKHPAATIHEIELATLHKEFATIVTTDEVLNSLPNKRI
ncbi:cysteine hydrolase [Neobacillus notoginsengisoli]|uniref:Cysteine hydrolase n=1 Tax=Neobacillus notoginsengisoli TaxID=1578198 RepID=A0A417YS24_9BACI|nr:cysteine hydrolase family protein [Neobacillus notoginsengisoli]RHW38104.1 cysteine hydrolase [Neobacillus notoginsengisoli]